MWYSDLARALAELSDLATKANKVAPDIITTRVSALPEHDAVKPLLVRIKALCDEVLNAQ